MLLNGIKKPILIIVIHAFFLVFYSGCSSVTIPHFALLNSGEESIIIEGKSIRIKDGFEYQFQQVYSIQKLYINYSGILESINLFYRTDGRWEKSKPLNVKTSSPLVIELDINADSIRILPEFSGKGQIALCKFYVGKQEKAFSVPLERPPFID